MQKIDFTQEVNAANTELRTKQNQFQSSLNEIDGLLKTGSVRPAQLLAALQAAAYCEDAIGVLGCALESEERKHTGIKDALKNGYQQKLDAIKSKAVSKASSVISDVSGFQDLADEVKESVTSVSKRSPDSIFSGTAHPASGPSNFSSARSEAQRVKAEFKKDALKSYSNIAWWGGGGAAVLSWVLGVSFVAGLGIGGLVALGAFVLYGSNYNTTAGAIRRLVNAAETEFASIRKEKLDSDAYAQKEYADQSTIEDDRFNSVKTSFYDIVTVADLELAELADRLSKVSEKWQDLNGQLFHRQLDGQPAQVNENRSTTLGTRFVVIGAASFSTTARSARSVETARSARSVDNSLSSNTKAKEPIEGEIYRGRVTKIVDFGAFVNFFGQRDGLVHISQIENRRLNHPSDVLKEGQEVWVKLLGFDDRGKVRLSMKVVDQSRRVNVSVVE